MRGGRCRYFCAPQPQIRSACEYKYPREYSNSEYSSRWYWRQYTRNAAVAGDGYWNTSFGYPHPDSGIWSHIRGSEYGLSGAYPFPGCVRCPVWIAMIWSVLSLRKQTCTRGRTHHQISQTNRSPRIWNPPAVLSALFCKAKLEKNAFCHFSRPIDDTAQKRNDGHLVIYLCSSGFMKD